MWRTSFLLVLLPCLALAGDVLVKTKYGMLQGHTVELHTGTIVNSFLGVPFAKPPIGKLRFRPPEEPAAYKDTLVAADFGHACPQNFMGILWLTHPGWLDYDEDCLTMNIYAPNNTKTPGPHPVMFWIHGGGYISSANIQYPGHFLAAKDVVVVVINYRINGLGFLSTGDAASPGNYGLMDQVRGLEFVRDNIAAFGGDPNKVTLFGQSAGGSSSSLMQFNPKAKGLFHQIIAESGSDLALWAINEGDHPQYAKQVATKLNCSTTNSQVMVDCLRTRTADEINLSGITCVPGYFCQGFAPVVDGPNGILPDTPLNLRNKGGYTKVPSIIGHTREDGSIYLALFDDKAWENGYTKKEFEDYLRFAVDYFAPQFPKADKEAVYQAITFYYSNWPHLNNTFENRDKLTEIITDVAWGTPGDLITKFNINGADAKPTYYYVLGYRSVNSNSTFPNWMGAMHNAELPYVMGWPLLQKNYDVRYDSGIWIDIIEWNQEDIEYVEYVQTLWTNFAKYGNPSPQPVPGPIGNGPTTWKAFTKEHHNWLEINRETAMQENYRQRNLAFWREYMPWLLSREITGTN